MGLFVVQAPYIEALNSIGAVERCHTPLHRVFGAVRLYNPSLPRTTVLLLALKCLYDTVGPNCLFLSLWTFGSTSRIPGAPEHPSQGKRLPNIRCARGEAE